MPVNTIREKITRLPRYISLWMDGSLFFRAVTYLMDLLRRICAGSFIVGLFTAGYSDEQVKESRFTKGTAYILNRFPLFFKMPEHWPKGLSDLLNGSMLIRTSCNALCTPVPPPKKNRKGLGDAGSQSGIHAVLQWAAFSLPVWGLLLITAGAPFLPTMLLAAMLAGVFLFTLFSHRFVIDLTAVFLILFILVTLFYGITSFSPSSSLPIALLSIVLIASFLLITACLRHRSQLDAFFFLFSVSAAGTGLIGVYQLVTKKVDMTWVDVALFGDIPFRAYSSFGNPNVYGTYLLLAIPLCAALFFYVKKPLYKLFSLGITALLLVNLLLTYSRGCYLALALTVLVFVLLVEKRLVVFFSAGIVVLPFVLPPTVINRLYSIVNLSDSSTSYRISIWQGTLRILKDFWMTGLGQGIDAYNTVYPFYAFNAVVAPHSHNLFLQVFVEMGIVGLLVFLAMLACFFREQARFLKHTVNRNDRMVAAAMVAAVVGFLFQGIFDYVFYNYRVMLVFFLFLGLGCAFIRISQSAEEKGETV